MEGYGADNPASKSQGIKQLVAGGGVALIGMTLVPLLSGCWDNPMCVRKPSAPSLIWEARERRCPHMIGDLIGEWIKGILIDGIMGKPVRPV